MLRLITLVLVVVAGIGIPEVTVGDGPEEETVTPVVIDAGTLPQPSGSASGSGGFPSPQMPGFQASGTTAFANVIDDGQITSPPPPVLAENVLGLNNADNAASGLEPRQAPSPQVAVSSALVLEMVEVLARAYDKDTLEDVWSVELGDLFDVPTPRCTETEENPCWQEGQPKLIFDAPSGRFIATYASYFRNTSGPDDARLHVAVSATGDPRGLWCTVTHPSLVGLYRYEEPWVGVTSDKITVGWDWFGIEDNSHLGADTRIYNKQQFLNCTTTSVIRTGHNPSLHAVRPAQHMTPGNTQVAATIEGNTLKVIRYTGVPGQGGFSQTVTNITLAGHAAPVEAVDPGGGFVETGDGRLLDTFVDGSSLWVTSNTSCEQPPIFIESCAQITQVNLFNNTVVQDIVYGAPGQDNYYPAARTDSSGNLIAVFNRSDAVGINIGARMVARGAGEPPNTLSVSAILQAGEISVTDEQQLGDPPTQWGAYFGAARDPSDSCVWVVGQYAKNIFVDEDGDGEDDLTGGNDWGTVVAAIAHPSAINQCDADRDGVVNSVDPEDDGDGYTDTAEAGAPLCLDTVNDDNSDDGSVNDGCPAVGAAESTCTDAIDNDLDGAANDGCGQQGAYSEGTFKVGTNAQGPCHEGPETGPSPSWPSDFVSGGTPNSTDLITVTDITSFIAPDRRLDTSPGDTFFTARWDLIPARGTMTDMEWINISDLTALFAGETGFPPMYGGAKAFGSVIFCTGP